MRNKIRRFIKINRTSSRGARGGRRRRPPPAAAASCAAASSPPLAARPFPLLARKRAAHGEDVAVDLAGRGREVVRHLKIGQEHRPDRPADARRRQRERLEVGVDEHDRPRAGAGDQRLEALELQRIGLDRRLRRPRRARGATSARGSSARRRAPRRRWRRRPRRGRRTATTGVAARAPPRRRRRRAAYAAAPRGLSGATCRAGGRQASRRGARHAVVRAQRERRRGDGLVVASADVVAGKLRGRWRRPSRRLRRGVPTMAHLARSSSSSLPSSESADASPPTAARPQIVAHASHGAVPVRRRLRHYSILQCRSSSVAHAVAFKRFLVAHEDVVLYCLSHGNQHCVVAAPREPERAFAAFAFSPACTRAARRLEQLLGVARPLSAASLEDEARSSRCRTCRAPAPLPADLSERAARHRTELAVREEVAALRGGRGGGSGAGDRRSTRRCVSSRRRSGKWRRRRRGFAPRSRRRRPAATPRRSAVVGTRV